MKETVVVGAGLVGTFLGIGLARRGYSVSIYDKRPDPRATPPASDRSLMIVLSARGFRALEFLGIDKEVAEQCMPIRGREIHNLDGSTEFQPYGQRGENQQAISRAAINRLMLVIASREPNVSLHFEHECIDVDPPAGKVFLQKRGEPFIEVVGDVVFGCDGAYSAVRQKLQRQPRFNYSQSFLSHVYREVSISRKDDGGWRLRNDAFHVWPRKHMMLAGFPNRDGSFGLSLFLPYERSGAEEGACQNDVDSVEAFRDICSQNFADVAGLLEKSADAYMDAPTGNLVTIRCFPWTSGRVALVGDSCHAILPFYGQGVNAGFEDCHTLLGKLDDAGTSPDWPTLLDDYQRDRKPQADAIADVSIENFAILQSAVGREDYLSRLALERRITEMFPTLTSPSLYGNITFRGMPYLEAKELDTRFRAVIDDLWQREQENGAALGTAEIRDVVNRYGKKPGYEFLGGIP